MTRRTRCTLAVPLWAALLLIPACKGPSGDGVHDETAATRTQPLTAMAVADDPLVRMPGTQPGDGVSLEAPNRCLNCHSGYNSAVEPGFNWKGSMMAQSARDPLFWACFAVAGQDALWATGRYSGTDLCERCHFPKGWLEGRSDPANASAMTGADFDGVQCDFCHRSYDPHFAATDSGSREGNDWAGYWDESGKSDTPSAAAARATYIADSGEAATALLFNGSPFFTAADAPFDPAYTEAGAGQFFVAAAADKRASFADAAARHQMLYSRFNKSRTFCATCHDVSNPILANLAQKDVKPLDGTTVLPSESKPAHAYFHVERTFSEFSLSAYGQPGGADGVGPFAPTVFNTSLPGNKIGRCQDCHMRDVQGVGANKNGVPLRPDESVEHPKSGQPLHDLTGGNIWVSTILASTVSGAPAYDAQNASLLGQGPDTLTLDLTQGETIDPVALLAGAERAKQQLQLAATIADLSYDAASGALSFKVVNQTGHKLISGFPEGRRMFVNVKAYQAGALIHEVNPYSAAAATLKGLDPKHAPASPALGQSESHLDALVYEMKPKSTLTGEEHTFHFALATGRYKDNRIPPRGFRIAEAAARLAEPVWQGAVKSDYFSAAEYTGGYDAVALTLPAGADQVVVSLYYQVTSREYVEFLRDELKGTRRTLPDAAYVAQTDPFFAKLKAWGDTIYLLWDHNKTLPGAAPFLMAQAQVGGSPAPSTCTAQAPTMNPASAGDGQVALSWSNEHGSDAAVVGYTLYYDQAGKSLLLSELGTVTSTSDSGLQNGQTYCYKVTARHADCESEPSNAVCATPAKSQTSLVGAAQLLTGVLTESGKGKNATVTFAAETAFRLGHTVTVRAYVADPNSGAPLPGATVTVQLSGPESHTLTSSASDTTGVADAQWTTSTPNKQGKGGTTAGSYTATVTGISLGGATWDNVATSTGFTLR